MNDLVMTLTYNHPIDLLRSLLGPEGYEFIRDHDQARLARYVLEALSEAGAEITAVPSSLRSSVEAPESSYSVVIPGEAIQIQVRQVVLDSIRDWLILAVVVATIVKSDGTLAGSVLGAAIAAFVRSVLLHSHRLNEHVGERCVIRAVLIGARRAAKKRPVEETEIFEQLRQGHCLLDGCRYRRGRRCRIARHQLKRLLDQLVADGVLARRGASSYEMPW